jgi:hypothetical protein
MTGLDAPQKVVSLERTPLMDTVVVAIILATWICLVLPAVVLQFVPRNLESQPQRAPRTGGSLSILSPKPPRDTSGGQAVA